MENHDFTELNAELRELRSEMRRQSGELMDLRLTAGDLKSEMKSLRGKLDAIRELPFGLDDYADLKKLLDHYLEIILSVTDTDAGSILLVKDGEDGLGPSVPPEPALVFISSAGRGSERLADWHFSGGQGVAGWVARHGVPYFAEDVEKNPLWSREAGDLVNYRAKDIMCVPMKTGNRVTGVIEVLNKPGAPYTRDDLDLMSFIAAHASIMVENAKLLADYDAKVRHLSTLMELSALINSSLRKEEVRRRAIEAATRLMDAEVGSLLLMDEATGELYFEVALGDEDSERKIKEIRLGPGEGIAGWVAKEARSVIVNDAQNDYRFYKEADKKTSFTTRNMVCVPVMTKGRVVGVLQAINKSGGRLFTESDRSALENLANQVAVAVENSRLYDQLRTTFFDTSETLADAIEKRDPYTGGHTRRVLKYSRIIAHQLGMAPEEVERVELAAILHDVGKLGVSDVILGKQTPLDEDEFRMMKMHPDMGVDIMSHVHALNDILPGIKHHHERIDGKGYPSGKAGDGIPMMAKIISVADSFDAMTTDRPYRPGLSPDYALSELKRCSGSQFEPAVVDAFMEAFKSGKVVQEDGGTQEGIRK